MRTRLSSLPPWRVALSCWLSILLLGLAGRSQAQSAVDLYYLTSDNSASTTTATDALNRVNYDNTNGYTGAGALATLITPSPVLMAIDIAGGRVFVYEGTVTSRSIKIISTSGALLRTITVPAVVTALEYDANSNYLYFITADAAANTTSANDALNRVEADNMGTGSIQVVVPSLANAPAGMTLNLASNEIYFFDNLATSRGIKTVTLTNGGSSGSVTRSVALSLAVTALDYSPLNGFIYYLTSDGNASASTANDALSRIRPDGNDGSTLITGIAALPNLLALDLANSRAFVLEGLSTSRAIKKVSLSADGSTGTLSTLLPLTPVTLALEVQQPTATVTTTAASTVTASSAVLGGNVTSGGNASVTERGVVYSSSNTTPLIGGTGVTKDVNGSSTGAFSETIPGLTSSTTYYVRAYAINATGTSYGSILNFTTAANATPTIGNQTRSIAENLPNGTNVGAVISASDTDAGQTLTYAITAGNTNGTFAINSTTGQLTVANSGALNFEATPSYSLTVQVTDNGTPAASASATVTVSVTNVNESPGAVTDVNPAANTVAENSATGTTVGITASATDPDAGTTLTYSLTDNAGGRFQISSSTGVVTVANGTLLDFEAATSHSITVQASDGSLTSSQSFTITVTDVDDTRPSVAITSTGNTNGGSTSTAPIPFTITFSESVTGFVEGDLTASVTGGTITPLSFSGSGTTYNFTVTPSGNGSVTVNVPANVAQDGASNFNTAASQFSVTYAAPSTTVASVTRLTPSPTATAQVSYRVVFAASVTGVTIANFTVTSPSATVTGASISSTSGSGTTYTVTVNTGTGDGTLRLNVDNSTGISPSISNVPYTTGEEYTITKSFAAAPTLRIQAAGSASGNGDVTAFLDVVQVLNASNGSAVANGLQNGSFETNNVPANSFKKVTDGVVAAPWAFTGTSGVTRNNTTTDFAPPTPPNGDAVALVQSAGNNNASLSQNLAVPTGSYQINFQTAQRNYISRDQRLNVFLNNVFVGSIQPVVYNSYESFTSAAFNVTAPALTATVNTTSASPTSTAPIPFSVSFTAEGVARSVGTTFTDSDVTVTGGTLDVASFSGSGGGPYTFTVTPSGAGTVSVRLAAGVASDANNTLNTASNQVSVQYQLPVTATPTLSVSGNIVNGQPTFSGSAPANSTVTITVVPNGGGTNTVLTATATAGGSFTYSVAQGQALPIGSYTATATAQSSGNTVSAASNQLSFTVPTTGPTTVITSTTSNPTAVTPIPVTVRFSRTIFDFDATDVTLANSGGTASLSNFTQVDNRTFTFDVTPSASGLVTVNVVAGVAQDSLSRNNLAAAQFSRQFNQPVTAAPVITSPTNNLFTNDPNITLVGTAPANSEVVLYLSQNGGPFQPTAPFPADANGTFSVGPIPFPEGAFRLYATAQNTGFALSANSATITFTVDQTAPTVAISSTAGASGGSTATTPIPFSVSFSETVNGSFVQGDLTVSGGSIVTGSFTGSGAGPYTFTVTPSGIGSTVSVSVPANVAQDAAGNFNTAAPAAYTLGYAPALTATVSTTSASPTSTSPVPFSASFSQSVGTSFTDSDVTVTNGTVTTGSFTGSGAGPYTFTVTPSGIGSTVTVRLTANVAQDAATTGNSASNSVSIQFQAPTITVAPPTLANGTVGTAYSRTLIASGGSGTYTYAITAGALPTGLTLTNGVIAGTPTASGSFTFTLTATDNSAAPGPYSGSRSYTVTIAAVMAVGWNGSVSTDWFTAANWSPNQVPDATINATIPTAPSGGRFPVIDANAAQASARNVSIAPGASLSMSANTLTIAANLTNNGAFNSFVGSGSTATGGTVVLGSTTTANILGSGSTSFWNLTVGANGAQQSTSAATSVRRVLTLVGNFITNGNSFTLVSDANGTGMVYNNPGLVQGRLTVQRYIDGVPNAGAGYRHYSAATSDVTVGNLATANQTPVVNPAYNTNADPSNVTPFPTIYRYEQNRLTTTTNNLPFFDKGWFSPAALSETLVEGEGYTLNLPAGETISASGTQHNGDYTVTAARGPVAGTPDQSGWKFMGNPYPSPLDLSQIVAADRPNMDGANYIWRSTSRYLGAYRAYVNGVGTGDPILAINQGFFKRVSAGQTSGSVTFRNSQRVSSYSSPVYPRSSRPLVQLDLQGGLDADPLVVYFEQGATAGTDAEFDAVKLPNTSGLNLSAVAGNVEMAINGLPLPTSNLTVPLQVRVPATGSYTLHAAAIVNLPAGMVAYLRDRQTGTVQDLSTTPDYTFALNAAYTGVRFELFFTPQRVTATAPASLSAQVAVFPNPAHQAVFVELPAALTRSAVTVTLVDALGRSVLTQQLLAGTTSQQLALNNVAAGVHAVRLQTAQGTVTKKLTVE